MYSKIWWPMECWVNGNSDNSAVLHLCIDLQAERVGKDVMCMVREKVKQ